MQIVERKSKAMTLADLRPGEVFSYELGPQKKYLVVSMGDNVRGDCSPLRSGLYALNIETNEITWLGAGTSLRYKVVYHNANPELHL